ncbi:unnamed protein product [Paramecium octaurelia]|uniref:Uncharacterized protein n=1 Tax=Paramecium octaurelia TaxID=43137 RepID=A0A8S1YN68_PAROT|nr:unnamed protein product [Paramecium octaurelia]CAD8215108.1 unnamed protein product [Paramecium octaurelia]
MKKKMFKINSHLQLSFSLFQVEQLWKSLFSSQQANNKKSRIGKVNSFGFDIYLMLLCIEIILKINS